MTRKKLTESDKQERLILIKNERQKKTDPNEIAKMIGLGSPSAVRTWLSRYQSSDNGNDNDTKTIQVNIELRLIEDDSHKKETYAGLNKADYDTIENFMTHHAMGVGRTMIIRRIVANYLANFELEW